jgi:hypothetical protein
MFDVRRRLIEMTAATILAAPLGANAVENGQQVTPADAGPEPAQLRIEIDNDLFTPTHRDRDYTGGFAVTWSGEGARHGLTLAPFLDWLDGYEHQPEPDAQTVQTVPTAPTLKRYARQIGALAFTPGNLTSHDAQHDDRPYASLLYVANGVTTVSPDRTSANIQTITVGVLGLPAFATVHRAIHRATGSTPPEGYGHQISAGGEPTARYLIAHQDLWYENPLSTVQVKSSVSASAGYLTETNAALSVRFGRFVTPWWGSTPEIDDYIGSPTASERAPAWTQQLYVTAGVRVTARAYNAFLQGQFRDSDVRYSGDEVRPVLGDAWVSLNYQSLYGTEVSYSMHYQTGELRRGRASGEMLWGGVQVSRYF